MQTQRRAVGPPSERTLSGMGGTNIFHRSNACPAHVGAAEIRADAQPCLHQTATRHPPERHVQKTPDPRRNGADTPITCQTARPVHRQWQRGSDLRVLPAPSRQLVGPCPMGRIARRLDRGTAAISSPAWATAPRGHGASVSSTMGGASGVKRFMQRLSLSTGQRV